MTIENSVILNVDDDEASRYARTRVLSRAGFSVEETATGLDTLAAVAGNRPDLVLLDVHLPDLDGVEVCRRIKGGHAGVIVVQVSASATLARDATSALNAGADAYLMEPVDPEVLVATVRALLRLRHTEKELAAANEKLREANEQLNAANNALRSSNEDLQQFAHVASHDLQEPLRTITTHSQLVQRSLGARLNAGEQESLKLMAGAAERMHALVRDILLFASVGRGEVQVQEVALNEAVSWAMVNVGESMKAAGAQLTVDELPVIWGDRTDLARLFQNLLGNSLKYRSDQPPAIHIGVRSRSASECTIYVRDNGIGIDPRYHDRIFAPFNRLHGYEVPGSGIGLALCRRIVERSGGRIWVESDAGAGATFLFTLRPV
jgi:two-component system, sensor histidine kinase and response regulator